MNDWQRNGKCMVGQVKLDESFGLVLDCTALAEILRGNCLCGAKAKGTGLNQLETLGDVGCN